MFRQKQGLQAYALGVGYTLARVNAVGAAASIIIVAGIRAAASSAAAAAAAAAAQTTAQRRRCATLPCNGPKTEP